MADKTVSPPDSSGKQPDEKAEPRVTIQTRDVPVDASGEAKLTVYDVTLNFRDLANALGCMEHDPQHFAREFLRSLGDELDVLQGGIRDGADVEKVLFATWSRVTLAGAVLDAIEKQDGEVRP